MRARSISSRRTLTALVAAIALAVMATALGARGLQAQGKQEPAATFRSRVDVVQVDAVVLDAQGRFVNDLRLEDFEVLEDGKAQRLANLQLISIPMERADAPLFATRPVVPDVRSNQRPFDGRLYLLVLDDLHTDASRSHVVRRLATEFIKRNLAANDLAAVVYTSGNRKQSQDFTNDPRLLEAAVAGFVGRKVMSPGLAGISMAGTPEASGPQAAASERMFNARSSLQTLSELVSFAGRIRDRRKAVVLFGEGIDYEYGRVGVMQSTGGSGELGFVHQDNAPREMRDRLKDVIDAANRGNVTLYAFDPRVYTQGGDDAVDIASGLPDDMTVNESENVKSTKLMDDVRASQDNLRTIANETGGFAVTGSRMAIDKGFERIKIENSNYYILGYYASNDARDGKFRKIEVKVKRPGVKVEARRGYTAPKGNAPAPVTVDAKEGTSAAVRDALAATLPVSGLNLAATAIPFKGTGSNATVSVLVQASGADLRFTPKGDRFVDTVELSAVAIDKTGKTKSGERLLLEMPLTARMQSFVAQAGLVFQLRMAVPPGSYQVRIAGRDAGSEKVGSVHLDLDVPDFAKTPLAMSGLLLTAERAGQVPNPRPDEELGKLLPGTPIATRDFDPGDVLTVFAEVYDNKAATPHKVIIATTIQGDDGRVLFKQEDERASSELQGSRGGYGFVASVPLKGLARGTYLLAVNARSTLDPSTIVTREILFRIK